MKEVYQTIVDKNNGNCLQAATASLFELPLESVPHFISFGDDWFKMYYEFLWSLGYEHSHFAYNPYYEKLKGEVLDEKHFNRAEERWKNHLQETKKLDSVDGLFLATVCSPKYFSLEDKQFTTHAVLVNTNMEIVFDPNKDYTGLKKYPYADELGSNGVTTVYVVEDLFKSGNMLVCQYMGAEIRDFNGQKYAYFPNKTSPSMYNEVTFERWSTERARYHESYDWLLPVVKKMTCQLGLNHPTTKVLFELLCKMEVRPLWDEVYRQLKYNFNNLNNNNN